MSFISGVWEKRAHPSSAPKWLVDLFGGRETASGVQVDEEKALTYTAVFACVRILAEGVASLPLPVYRRLTPRGKARATDHHLYRLLHDAPNPEMTSLTWRETSEAHVALWGNAYCEIEYDNGERPKHLWPITPKRVKATRPDPKGPLVYEVRLPKGGVTKLPARQMFHIPGLSLNGSTGLSVIGLAREAVGLGLATEEFGARFFSGNAIPGAVLEHPGALSDNAHDRLKESWEDKHRGLEQSHRLDILEEGMKFTQIGVPPEDAQFLETRKFQVNEIARLFHIPPHMIGDLERATFSNIEQQSLEFVIYTLRPWLVRWEQALKQQLFTEQERESLFPEFLIDGLLRGDTESRFRAYAIGRTWGWMSADDIRELENMNPLPNGRGSTYLVPLNMQPAPAVNSEGRSERRSAAVRRQLGESFRRVFADAAARIVRREEADIMRLAKRLNDPDALRDAVKGFYAEHEDFVRDQMHPPLASFADSIAVDAGEDLGEGRALPPEIETFIAAYALSFGTRWVTRSESQVLAVVGTALADGEDVVDALQLRFDQWAERRPAKVALEETVRSANAVTQEVWKQGGLERTEWQATGKSCPYCESLNGKTMSIGAPFLNADTAFEPDGADRPLTPSTNIGHPPAHAGCLPGGARVSAQGIAATTKRRFDGDLLVISVANGQQLSCTPNHPILTLEGWKAAELLNMGDDVVCHLAREWLPPPVNGDEQHVPSTIQEITDAFRRRPSVAAIPMPTAAEDFHGDGMEGEVAVVWADRLLLDCGHSSFSQKPMQVPFEAGYEQAALLLCDRCQALFRERLLSPRRSLVGSSGLRHALGGGHPARPHSPSRAPTANRDTSLQQPPANGRAIHADLARQGIFRLPSQIAPSKITDLQRHPFSGHVYNLQTESGFYVAESIITHNCDCGLAPA